MTLCQVCFTGADGVMRESLNAGIGVLLVVTALVLAAFARFFITLARRSREGAHLVQERGISGAVAGPDARSLKSEAVGYR